MGALADQMGALVDGILASSRERSAAIAEARASTARILSEARALLAGISEGRREMGEKLDQELRGAASELTAKVAELLCDLDRAHAQQTADMAQFLAGSRGERSGDLEALMAAAGQTRAEVIREVTHGLWKFANHVHAETTRFLSDARAARTDEAQATQHRVVEALSALRTRVAALANESAGFLGRCEEERGTMGLRLRESLSLTTETRREKLGSLLGGFRDSQQKLADDLRASTGAWRKVAQARADVAAQVARLEPKPAEAAPATQGPAAKKGNAPKRPARAKKPRKNSAAG